MSNKRTNKRNILKRHHISFNKNKSDKKSQDELHQQKFNRATRKALQKDCGIESVPQPSSSTLKFASININGLDLEAEWFVNEVLKTRQLDVIFRVN